MSDWPRLNKCRVLDGFYASTASDGFNGLFYLTINGVFLKIIASDGMSWEHVSVSIAGSTQPSSWSIMSQVKDLFFEPEEWVVQYHPAKSEYVNTHPGCLHLWKCIDREMPTPPIECV